ncbi:copia protein [Tanacetum coccineum]
MESEKYLEGQSMQRPPLFESNGFIYWKNRFETYVKSKDLDLWHVITDGDFLPIKYNFKTKKDEIVPFHKQDDDLKKKLAKNNEAKMPPKNNDQRAFIGGAWSDNEEDEVEKTEDETCIIAQAPDEICLGVNLEPDEWIKDSGCSKHMTDYLTKFDPKSYEGVFLGYSQNSKAYIILNKQTMKVEESLNVTFDETPPPPKTSPLEDDELVEEEAIESEEGLPLARYSRGSKTSHLDREAVFNVIFRYIKGTMHLGLWYPKGSGIETIVYADSDHAGDYVDRKSTSGVCTFMGCCLTSWFLKKQTALAISTYESELCIDPERHRQQALWMELALVGLYVH